MNAHRECFQPACRHLSDEDFAARHLPAGAAPADGAVAEKRAAVDAAFARTAAAAAATLNALPEVDAALLLSLRTGHRRWRLDQADWLRLAAILARQGGEASRSNALQRLVLAVRLRGKLELEARRVRRNPYLLEAVATGAAKMPAADAQALLAQWRRLPEGAAGRALTRVMRYAALTPREQPDLDQVCAAAARSRTSLVPQPQPPAVWHRSPRSARAGGPANANTMTERAQKRPTAGNPKFREVTVPPAAGAPLCSRAPRAARAGGNA